MIILIFDLFRAVGACPLVIIRKLLAYHLGHDLVPVWGISCALLVLLQGVFWLIDPQTISILVDTSEPYIGQGGI